jgi:hypothetical protein
MNEGHDAHFELTPNDRRLLDALFEAGFDVEALETGSDEERRRLEMLGQLFGLLNDYPVDEADDTLLHATIARIDRYDRDHAAPLRFEPVLEESNRGFRGMRIPLAEFLAVAAVIIIALAVGWPMVSKLRASSIDQTCQNNMRVLANAFGAYAQDYNDVLPMAVAGVGPASWDQVRNIVNLRPLVEYGYCTHGHLNCPGNHDHYGASYSYQWQRPATILRWGGGPTLVILGDRNPLIDATIAGNFVPPDSVSINHAGRGQNVLMSDGSIRWLTEPKIGRDNIWLPDGTMYLETGQQPSGPEDAFLVH